MRPQKPPSTSPLDSRYWDPRDLEEELQRVFSICHGCRMCVGYCPSFPEMFKRVDNYVTLNVGEIEAFTDDDYREVNDLCYQCKLCYFKCPYTPDDDHPFQVDFPRLMFRHKAHRATRDGVTVQDKVLGEPQRIGRLASGAASHLANFVTKQRLLRKVQEKVTGVSSEFNLPPFATESLRTWFAKQANGSDHQENPSSAKPEICFFSTCTVDYNLPAAGRAAIQVLEHNGFCVSFPEEQTCCGMPNLDGGDIASAQEKARRNVEVLAREIDAGRPIVCPGPTCSYVIKKEYLDLLGPLPDVIKVADNTYDLMEFLLKLSKKKTLNLDFKVPLGKVAYHVPCHLRAQKVGFPAERVLKKIQNTEIERIEECSAVDGTWGMKAQYYELGRKYAQKLINGVRSTDFDVIATDCPLSGLRLTQELGVPSFHPIELLNRAYGLPTVEL